MGEVTRQVQTFVGAPPGGRLRRFRVGLFDCEFIGLAETKDGCTSFVNIPHPGQNTPAAVVGDPGKCARHSPDGAAGRARLHGRWRSSTITTG